MKHVLKPAAKENKLKAVVLAIVFTRKNKLGRVGYGSMFGEKHSKVPIEYLAEAGLEDTLFFPFPHYYNMPGEEELTLFAKPTTTDTKLETLTFEWLRISEPLVAIDPPEFVKLHHRYGGTLIAYLRGLQKPERVKQGKIYFIPDLTS